MAKNRFGGGRLAYMVVDTETATFPFADEIAGGDSDKKKKIAIARPLVYDIGWTICLRDGTILERKSYLVAETFSVPAIFNTAYYKDKKPLYIEKMRRQEITLLPWDAIMQEFVIDLEKVDAVGAFNSMFDFKKAIPFTELYIRKLYGYGFYEWEQLQKEICERIAKFPYRKDNDKEFNGEVFEFRGEEYMLFDLWGLAAKRLINNDRYKKACLDNGRISASGEFFLTSAESVFQHLIKDFSFIEEHTALSDAEIESHILGKVLSKGKMEIGISFFPFQELGTTVDYLAKQKKPNPEHLALVETTIRRKLKEYDDKDIKAVAQRSKLHTSLGRLMIMGERA